MEQISPNCDFSFISKVSNLHFVKQNIILNEIIDETLG
jgi:hypothetical protein